MSINLEKLRELLKATKYPVFRDKAPKYQEYPYIVYSFISEDMKMASGRVFKYMPLYQVSLFTTGTEKEFRPIMKVLDVKQVTTSGVMSIVGDENDDTVTNFFIQVRTIEDG
ncbi:hypothetical protein [Enterococcus gilvus]|uniref:Uncharacterized protein n=1 Tax=Enterococcus gilvus ATCC BAA-350 TaxID=1158614 RepID=R2VIH1_9ENTE|nr:hypothetical protein [Enterococcus gilvus]EOI57421.1 hypothetical protein UKC_01637 [Enterococcus gilvus ATCC BAA-350]EOW83005.1 hypothetical protein I592_02330 [Enterococcus gilvus ATCC BAA-350]OJG41044.1 hypothetical protein RV02_GL001260 [Enterococcus gilvus]